MDPKTTYRELAIRKRSEEIWTNLLRHPPEPKVIGELGWTGRTYFDAFPGCTHPEGHE